MDFAVLPSGIVKSKQYCPNPIAKYGIPHYADSIANPKCVGTPAYHEWWKEQVHYILNGYETGGIWVPGRYYKFVNFDTIRGVAGDAMRAELHDFQLDYAYFIEQAKQEHFNIIIPKARRKTITTSNVCMVLDYGFRFEQGYKAGIIAGQQKFADTFYDEWMYTNANQYPEFRLRNKGDADTVAVYEITDAKGNKMDAGSMNTVYTRTVFHDPNVMKGKYLNDVILEESGENEHLVECVGATMDCLMRGDIQYGIMAVYGTGGNVNKGSKGFKQIYMDAIKDGSFNGRKFRTLFIPATVFYFPYYAGATDKDGKLVEDIPNLQHLKPHERVGWSDEEKALEVIEAKKAELLKKANLKDYFDYTQNNPTNVKEVFRKSATNNFPIITLNDQAFKIESESKKYSRFTLEYEKEPDGSYVRPLRVRAVPASPTTPDYDCVLILNDGHPIPNYRWLDVAGIDSYDQDKSLSSSSLGAMVVFRGRHNIPGIPEWCPVALIRSRPPRKEMFYEMCLKLSIYYNLEGAVLGDVANALIVQHFKDAGCFRYISKAPKKFESPNNQAVNDFWIRLTGYTKPRMVSALQSFYSSHIEKVWFEQIIEESLNYDEFEVDSDNDTVDALGIAIMKVIDQDMVARDESEFIKKDPFAYPEYGYDRSGNIVSSLSQVNKMMKDEPIGKYEDHFSRYARLLKSEEDDDWGDDPADKFSI